MELKSGSISRSVRVGKFVGVGFLNVVTSRGDVKMYSGDHLVEVEYERDARLGEVGYRESDTLEEVLDDVVRDGPRDTSRRARVGQGKVLRRTQFVVPEDAARALGIFLEETVEEERARLLADPKLKDEARKRAEKAIKEEQSKAKVKLTDAQVEAAIAARVDQEASVIVDEKLKVHSLDTSITGRALAEQKPGPALGPLSDRIETNEAINRRVSGAPLGSVGGPNPNAGQPGARPGEHLTKAQQEVVADEAAAQKAFEKTGKK